MAFDRNKFIIAAIAITALGSTGWWLWPRSDQGPLSPTERARVWASQTTLPVPSLVEQPRAAAPAARHSYTQADQQLLAELRQRFAPVLQYKHAQIKLIEQLLSYLKEKHPDRWRALAAQFLADLFPELAEALLAKFDGLMAFNGWLETHRDQLRSMSAEERRSALWAARYATFGEDANEIWAIDLKNQQIRDALVSLNESQGLSVNEQLATYLGAIEAAYGDQAQDFLQSRQTELTGHFLSVDAVQDQLHALSNEERAAALSDIRSAMGMSPEAVSRWSALDQQRDESWRQGQSYMQARAQVMQQYEGEDQQRELARLRASSFGQDNAKTIKAEEDSGFYRYANRRRIGRE